MTGAPPLVATYRLQLTPEFGFDAAAAVLPYIADLGISHLYLSPIFQARTGSAHGYDQTDPTRIRAELGGEAAFERLVEATHRAGLGILLDIVPNHMAAHPENPWWNGLLRDGAGSSFERFFEVDWEAGQRRLVLPVLGAPLAEVIARGELTLERDAGDALHLRYFDRCFPLRADCAPSEAAQAGDAQALLRLAQAQHYELCFWRDGLRRINYRRFFDIADLAAVRVEDPLVFDATHALVLELAKRGCIDGVRVDHIDGLRDPLQYLRRLRAALDAASPPRRRIAVFVEKVLARGEPLPAAWPVDGATGYRFMATVAALMTGRTGLRALRQTATEQQGSAPDFRPLAIAAKREAAETLLGAELGRLCREVRSCMEFAAIPCDPVPLRRALVDLSAHLAVYRTYGDEQGMIPAEAERIQDAGRRAADEAAPCSPHAADAADAQVRQRLIESLVALFTLSGPFAHGLARTQAMQALQQWQQFTGPLAAKGVEDTALYRDTACPSLNEVGSEPVEADPATLLKQLSEQCMDRWQSLNATDTHDAKRSEDVRARLAVLARRPEDWGGTLDEIAAQLRASLPQRTGSVPTAVDLAMIVQSAFALWPLGLPDGALADRLKAYIVKAGREAKETTSWARPDAAYERACEFAVDQLLFGESLALARASIVELARRTRPLAARLSMAAILLKGIFPGVPDWYQGTGLRALSLVDPDNRRPVDFPARHALLARLRTCWAADPRATATELLLDPDSDAAKLLLTWRVLVIRRQLMAAGAPIKLETFEIDRAQWLWCVTAGAQRCTVTIRFGEQGDAGSVSAQPVLLPTLDQLTARAAGEPSLWASVCAEPASTLW